MRKIDFKTWFSTFRTKQDDVYTFNYFVNFEEVYKEMNNPELRICLKILDSLKDAHEDNIEEVFRKILHMCKEVKKYLPLLVAVKLTNDDASFNLMDSKTSKIYHYNFNDLEHLDEDKLCIFMQETGIFDLYLNHLSSST